MKSRRNQFLFLIDFPPFPLPRFPMLWGVLFCSWLELFGAGKRELFPGFWNIRPPSPMVCVIAGLKTCDHHCPRPVTPCAFSFYSPEWQEGWLAGFGRPCSQCPGPSACLGGHCAQTARLRGLLDDKTHFCLPLCVSVPEFGQTKGRSALSWGTEGLGYLPGQVPLPWRGGAWLVCFTACVFHGRHPSWTPGLLFCIFFHSWV